MSEPKRYTIPPGTTFRPCRECRTPIAFVLTENNRRVPVTADGVSHFTNCTNPKRFSKGRAN